MDERPVLLSERDVDYRPKKRRAVVVLPDQSTYAAKTPHLKARNLLNHLNAYTFTGGVDQFAEYMRWCVKKKWGVPLPMCYVYLRLLMSTQIIYVCIRTCYEIKRACTYLWEGAPTRLHGGSYLYPSKSATVVLMGFRAGTR